MEISTADSITPPVQKALQNNASRFRHTQPGAICQRALRIPGLSLHLRRVFAIADRLPIQGKANSA
jgi:hypothetical protein